MFALQTGHFGEIKIRYFGNVFAQVYGPLINKTRVILTLENIFKIIICHMTKNCIQNSLLW